MDIREERLKEFKEIRRGMGNLVNKYLENLENEVVKTTFWRLLKNGRNP